MEPGQVDTTNELITVLTTPQVPEIRRTLTQIRPELAEDSLAFRAAVLLMIGPAASFNIDRMAGRAQIPRNIVAACARRLFDNGVWHPDGAAYVWRSPDDDQFWFDVSVAEGKLCRHTDPLGRIEWAAAGAWRKPYEFSSAGGESLSVSYLKESAAEVLDSAADGPVGGEKESAEPKPEAGLARETVRRVRPKRVPLGAARAASGWVGTAPRADLFPDASWLK